MEAEDAAHQHEIEQSDAGQGLGTEQHAVAQAGGALPAEAPLAQRDREHHEQHQEERHCRREPCGPGHVGGGQQLHGLAQQGRALGAVGSDDDRLPQHVAHHFGSHIELHRLQVVHLGAHNRLHTQLHPLCRARIVGVHIPDALAHHLGPSLHHQALALQLAADGPEAHRRAVVVRIVELLRHALHDVLVKAAPQLLLLPGIEAERPLGDAAPLMAALLQVFARLVSLESRLGPPAEEAQIVARRIVGIKFEGETVVQVERGALHAHHAVAVGGVSLLARRRDEQAGRHEVVALPQRVERSLVRLLSPRRRGDKQKSRQQ